MIGLLSQLSSHPLIRKMAANLAIKFGLVPLSFILSVILARLLGSAEFGVYALYVSVATILASGLVRANGVYLVREIAAGIASGDQLRRLQGIKLISLVNAVSGLLILIGMGVYIYATRDANYLVALMAIGILVVNIVGPTLRGHGYTSSGLIVEQVVRPLSQLVLIAFAVLLFSNTDFDGSFGGLTYLVGVAIASAVGLIILQRVWSPLAVPVQNNSMHWERLRTSVGPLIFLGYLQGADSEFAILAMGLLSTTDEIGRYRVADSFAGLITLALLAANITVGPKLAALAEDKKKFERLLRMTTTLVAAVALPLAALLVIFGGFLIDIFFGPEYISATEFLWVLCMAAFLNAFCGPIALAVNMLGRESINIRAIVLSLIVGGVASLALVPTFGGLGAAIAKLISIFVWNMFLVWYLKRDLGINALPGFQIIAGKKS